MQKKSPTNVKRTCSGPKAVPRATAGYAWQLKKPTVCLFSFGIVEPDSSEGFVALHWSKSSWSIMTH